MVSRSYTHQAAVIATVEIVAAWLARSSNRRRPALKSQIWPDSSPAAADCRELKTAVRAARIGAKIGFNPRFVLRHKESPYQERSPFPLDGTLANMERKQLPVLQPG